MRRLGLPVSWKVGRNINATTTWRKRAEMVDKINKCEAEYMERFGRREMDKYIHRPFLFGAKGKNTKKSGLEKEKNNKRMAIKHQNVLHPQVREET